MSVNTRLAAQAVSPPAAQRKASAEPEETLADRMSVGFDDLLDVVNPLQQLPVVSSVYREATGAVEDAMPKEAGGLPMGIMDGQAYDAHRLALGEAYTRYFEEAGHEEA